MYKLRDDPYICFLELLILRLS